MQKTKPAYTLIELIVATAIISILAVSTFIVLEPTNRITTARDSKTKSDAEVVIKAFNFYRLDNGIFPLRAGSSESPVNIGSLTAASTCSGYAPSAYDDVVPDYYGGSDTAPAGSTYFVALADNGSTAVCTYLVDGTKYVVAE